jgi:hypothetical protein
MQDQLVSSGVQMQSPRLDPPNDFAADSITATMRPEPCGPDQAWYLESGWRGEILMRPIEDYLKRVDELADQVISEGAKTLQHHNAEFKPVFETAYRYRTAKRTADNRREFGMLTEQDAAEEKATRLAFVEVYKPFSEKHEG